MNGTKEDTLSEAINSQKIICTDDKLKHLVACDNRKFKDNTDHWIILYYLVTKVLKSKEYVLYYQQPNLSFLEDSSERFYQLILSDNFWLKNA